MAELWRAYVLIEWISDNGLSVEETKHVHTTDDSVPIVGEVYGVEFRETGRSMIVAIGEKEAMYARMATMTPDDEAGQTVESAKRKQKRSKPSGSLQKAKDTIHMDSGTVDILVDEDEVSEIELLRQKVTKLEKEKRDLQAQIDIQDTLRQLKKVVRKLGAAGPISPSSQTTVRCVEDPEDPARLEQKWSFVHLKYRPSDKDVVELIKGTHVYIGVASKTPIDMAKSDTTMARNLMCQVFRREALLACSVRGNFARGKGKGKDSSERKQPLNPRAVNAILKYVLERFRRANDRSPALVTAMGTRLSELRAEVCVEDVAESTAEEPVNAAGDPATAAGDTLAKDAATESSTTGEVVILADEGKDEGETQLDLDTSTFKMPGSLEFSYSLDDSETDA